MLVLKLIAFISELDRRTGGNLFCDYEDYMPLDEDGMPASNEYSPEGEGEQ